MKPLLRTLGGEAVWPPPVWLMRQAGRYLPEYRAVRAGVKDFIALCTTPELAAEVTLQPIRRYGFDAAILFSDILILPWALGHGLEFREGEGPVLPKLHDEAGVAALDPSRVADRVAPVMETVRLVRTGLATEGFADTTLIGFAGAPFTVACYMIEGGGSKDFANIRGMAYAQPALFQRLMDTLTDASIEYLSAQVTAGAEALMLFDSWAGVLSPRLFRAHVIEPAKRIVAALNQRHPGVPIIGFPRLAATLAGDYAAATRVNGVGLDTAADLPRIAAMMPPSTAVQGNLDPLALVAGGAAMAAETAAILDAMRHAERPFIFNLGHGIVPQTPPEHVAALLRLVRAAS
ncbi:uroporphyrinogen decarboxylase [Acidisphaera sp. S103]|uniref:uroporphyrinogen decarboxylase n=1 Tax=Acidisphaera sp. S103 TaxID=1747223 RepID=UPI00131CE031|nr:uroporphyrinogen decarboxylase [Acidisphaera sp. S103]